MNILSGNDCSGAHPSQQASGALEQAAEQASDREHDAKHRVGNVELRHHERVAEREAADVEVLDPVRDAHHRQRAPVTRVPWQFLARRSDLSGCAFGGARHRGLAAPSVRGPLGDLT